MTPQRLSHADALALADEHDIASLMRRAAALRDDAFGDDVTFSKKVFIPLTHLCRDACGYCTFAHTPKPGRRAYLTPGEVLDIARAGERAGCAEALFTLGDKPELRWRQAREELDALGFATTIEYLAHVSALVLRETSLLPHANPGVMTADELAALRKVSVSQGIMLESTAERLGDKGGPHWGAPDKAPAVRLATIAEAGRLAIPFTSGILIGIGETRRERVEALLALRDLHDAHGHLQEVIVQNFRAKPKTPMARSADAETEDLLWTIAVARIVFGGAISIQAPPNLQEPGYGRLIEAGIDDWGGVSPVTPDHVNPERPWPQIDALAAETARMGKRLVERLAVYPRFALASQRWQDPALAPRVLAAIDAQGLRRTDAWQPGTRRELPAMEVQALAAPTVWRTSRLAPILDRAQAGATLDERDIVRLFAARGSDFGAVCTAADELRAAVNGDVATYAVVRNINYTNICYFRCRFCAFSKGKLADNLRGAPYDIGLDEIARRSVEAWERGATEVCMQGGIHPDYTGRYYLDIVRAVKRAVPDMHVHAFSPLEVWHGATTLGLSIGEYAAELKRAGLGSLPGTAAEVLDDEVRDVLCPDKVSTDQWLDIVRAAHRAGLRSTATIMYGHIERTEHWARHLLRLRALQADTGGLTELVPLPFVASEAPIALKGGARSGPTFRESILMHAVARLALHPLVPNIQGSWVKLGPEGLALALRSGANDMGGTLMNESITRAAGAEHGEEFAPAAMEALAQSLGRVPRMRTTLYEAAPEERRVAAMNAADLAPLKLEIAHEHVHDNAHDHKSASRREPRRLAKPRDASGRAAPLSL